MSKYTDFYPAAAGTAFPFTGSGGITGSLEVRGGVGFRYYDRGSTQGWTDLGAGSAMNTQRGGSYGVGTRNSAIYASGRNTAGAAFNTATETWDGTSWSTGTASTQNRLTAGAGGFGSGISSFGMAGGRNAVPADTGTQATELWDGATWSTAGNITKPGNAYYSMQIGTVPAAWDVGGSPGLNTMADFDGTNWSANAATLNTARRSAGAAGSYSSGFIFASQGPGAAGTRTESWNGTTWSENSPTTDYPIGLSQLSGGGNLTSAIGTGGWTGATSNQTAEWNGSNWTNLSPTYNMPTANRFHRYVGNAVSGITGNGPNTTNTLEWEGRSVSAGQYETFTYSETTGVTTVSQLVETSAERFKEDIKDLPSQTEKIKNLQPVQYSWKRNNKQDIGFIAERFDNHYPELVHKKDGQAEGIEYTHLVSALVKELQDQQSQIEEIQNKIQEKKK
jgi:hypothetical protein